MTVSDDDQGVSLYVGGLSDKVTEELLWELFVQAGPISSIKLPQDNVTKKPKTFAFVHYTHAISGEYAVGLFNETSLYGRNIVVRASHRNTTPAASPASPYTAAKAQLAGLQQQLVQSVNLHPQTPMHNMQSASSLLGTYSGGPARQPMPIPYHTPPRHDVATPSPRLEPPRRHSASPYTPDRQQLPPHQPHSSSVHSSDGHSGSRRSTDYDRPAERRYSRDDRMDRRDSTEASSTNRDRGHPSPASATYPHAESHRPSLGYEDRHHDSRRPDERRYDDRDRRADDRRYDSHEPPQHAQRSAYQAPRDSGGYGFTPDRQQPASSRYHPYSSGRPGEQHRHPSSQQPPQPSAAPGPHRQYNNRYQY
ncbi:RNA-binding protein 7-like [Sycon ciliatum]|uniref:RNA-binding protein 7-like n=1 Tax=Sycon ciliatum TaxID=27933 RepID=UPI0020ADD5A4|eukprot:scpid18360/ scgid0743/ RNA-binding protein 7; RNA-binding motif protein 7